MNLLSKFRYSLAALALTMLPPAIASLVALSSPILFGAKSKVYSPVAFVFGLLFLTSFFAVIASFFFGNSVSEAIEALKFLFMAFCLISGAWLKPKVREIQSLGAFLAILIVGWYALATLVPSIADFPFRPPDNNGSAILLFFLCLVITENRSLVYRMVIVGVMVLFANTVDSRLLLLLVPFIFLSQPISLSLGKALLFSFICLCVYLWTVAVGMWGNWSDTVRLLLYASVLEVFSNQGVPIFASGQAAFVNAINAALPNIVSSRLELVHAHNAFFQVLGSYGALAGLSFSGVFITLFLLSYRLENVTLRNLTVFLVCAMLIETVISDSRAAYIMFLFIGFQIGAARYQYPPRPNT